MNGFSITKKEARKILSRFRCNKEIEVEELLRRLNDEEIYEVMIDSWAKVCGKDRNFYLRTYAHDDRDGRDALNLINKSHLLEKR